MTTPNNKAIPPVGALMEVRYLYPCKDGSLYQPAYFGERDDLDETDCNLEQLKRKLASGWV